MLANKRIFCNTPWYELHIYWDGSFGICCQESHKLYSTGNFNVATMSIADWFNSDPVKSFRTAMFGDQPLSACDRCYKEEQHGGNSRRVRSNQKSVIFTTQAFDNSFVQSPGHNKFAHSAHNNGHTVTHPIDLHIDLGNYCNLACKMCNSQASSTIASQTVKWGVSQDKKYLGQDWTRDQSVWNNFKQQLLEIPGLNNIHLMGGETLLTDRFEDLVDFMTLHQRFDLCFSFVTNGTVYKPALIEKLKKFKRVGLEISIETLDARNAYIRQGTDTNEVLKNIDRYLAQCNGHSVTVSLRPAPGLLSVGSYIDLLKFAINKKLVVKSNLCYTPRFLSIEVLPDAVKSLYISQYRAFMDSIQQNINGDYNASDPNNFQAIVKHQANLCMGMLETPAPPDIDQQLKLLVDHCHKWDQVYNLNARELYPELNLIWDQYGY